MSSFPGVCFSFLASRPVLLMERPLLGVKQQRPGRGGLGDGSMRNDPSCVIKSPLGERGSHRERERDRQREGEGVGGLDIFLIVSRKQCGLKSGHTPNGIPVLNKPTKQNHNQQRQRIPLPNCVA